MTARSISFACRIASSDRLRSVISRELSTYPAIVDSISNRLPIDSNTRQAPLRWRVAELNGLRSSRIFRSELEHMPHVVAIFGMNQLEQVFAR